MRGAVVCYPKNPVSRSIRLLTHDEIDQLSETVDTRAGFAQTKDFGLSHIPCRHIRQRPLSFIFMFNSAISSSTWSAYAFQPTSCLNTGFFIGRDNEIIFAKRCSIPKAMIQIKYSGCFLFKIRITGPNPTAVAPWPNGIFAQPSPNCFSTDGCDKPLSFGLPGDFIMCKFGEGKSEVFGQLASKGLHRNDDFRGKKRRASRAVAFPGGQPVVGQRSVSAISKQSAEANPAEDRFVCLKSLRRQGERFWLA